MLRFGLVLCIFVTGCLSTSSLQTAETLAPGTGQFIVGVGKYQAARISDLLGVKEEDASKKESTLNAELSYRRGWFEHFDSTFKATLPGTIGIDLKYQFVDSGGFDMGLGVGANRVSHRWVTPASTHFGLTVIDVIIPIYSSFRLTPALAIYAHPKYLKRYMEISTRPLSGAAASSQRNIDLAGASLGVAFGSTSGFVLEYSYLKEATSDFFTTQSTLGFYF